MKIFNTYILTVAIALLATVVILAALGQPSLDVYYTLFIVEALIITELYVYLNSKARRQLNLISWLLFAGFLFVVVQKVAVILA